MLKTVTFDPEKWQVVPKKMTYEMRNVVWMSDGDWRELLDTAPRTTDGSWNSNSTRD